MSTIPLSEAKARLSELVESVDRTHERVTITKNGREAAMIISTADYASLEATLELLMDPAAQERIRLATAEIAAGDVVTGGDLAALLAVKRPGR
ncbi:type II toxin-antitoxin system Phd/YefM family antitoxin [soil metagenome]